MPVNIVTLEAEIRRLTVQSQQEAEIRRIMVQSQSEQIIHETLSRKNPAQKRAGGVVQGVDPEFKPQYCK
jgi:hypothetical protein